jgi:hypothetical protein
MVIGKQLVIPQYRQDINEQKQDGKRGQKQQSVVQNRPARQQSSKWTFAFRRLSIATLFLHDGPGCVKGGAGDGKTDDSAENRKRNEHDIPLQMIILRAGHDDQLTKMTISPQTTTHPIAGTIQSKAGSARSGGNGAGLHR